MSEMVNKTFGDPPEPPFEVVENNGPTEREYKWKVTANHKVVAFTVSLETARNYRRQLETTGFIDVD